MSALKPGAMGSQYAATTPNEFVDSMAAAIEDEYWAALAADGKDTFNRTKNRDVDRDRRRIFVAIARGVTKYLHDNADALDVKADAALPANTRIEIDVNL